MTAQTDTTTDTIAGDDEQLTPTEALNLRAVTDVLEYWNRQDIDGMFAFYHDDITWTNAALGEVYRGKAEVRVFLEKLFTAFPDLTFVVDYKFARGDQVAERWTIHGTHLGPFMGVPPTGKTVAIPGIGMVRMREGRFLTDWFLLDVASTMRQMGLLPPLSVGETPVGRVLLWAAVNRKVVGVAAGGLALAGLLLGRRRG
jgi:steroid delta-isomerase-like uncharacterized protein